MKALYDLLPYPYLWQSLLSSFFTLGFVALLAWIFGIKEARVRVWAYSLPFLVPLLLPFQDPAGRLHWGPVMVFQNHAWFHLPDSGLKLLVLACFLPQALALILGMLSYIASRGLLRGGREVTEASAPELFTLLVPLTSKAHILMPRVYFLPPDVRSKVFVCGIFHPRLALAPSLLSSLRPDELQAVLAHEVAHLARHDQVFYWVTLLLRSLMFYNPMLYPLGRRLGREREKAADALAAAWMGEPESLARGLLRVTRLTLEERLNLRSRYTPVAGLTNGEALCRRVELLLESSPARPSKMSPARLWFIGISFMLAQAGFVLWVLLPLCHKIPCVMMLLG